MYTYREQNKRSGITDMLIVVGIIIALIVMDYFLHYFSNVSLTENMLAIVMLSLKGGLVLAMVVLCVLIYTKLLCTYRYTFVYESVEQSFAIGTLFIETCVADKGNLIFEVGKNEYRAFFKAGQALPKEFKSARVKKFSAQNAKHCSRVIIYRDGKLYCLLISPDERLTELLVGVCGK